MENLYYYADPITYQQQGPIPLSELQTLISNGTLSTTTLVWNNTLPTWIPIQQISSIVQPSSSSSHPILPNTPQPPLSTILSSAAATTTSTVIAKASISSSTPQEHIPSSTTSSTTTSLPVSSSIQYFYADNTGTQMGPIPQEAFISLLEAGYVNKDTLVWTTTMPSWLPMIQYTPLAQYLEKYLHVHSPDSNISKETKQISRKRTREEDNIASSSHSTNTNNTSKDTTVPPSSNMSHNETENTDSGTDDDNDGDETKDGNHTTDTLLSSQNEVPGEKQKKRRNRKKKNKANGPNTWIYVSGLPLDTNEDEIHNFFRIAGMIRVMDGHGTPRIKLYRTTIESSDPHHHESKTILKGDCSICYLMPESVELAIELFDGTEFRKGYNIQVEEAKFDKKDDHAVGENNSSSLSASSHKPGMDMYSGLLSASTGTNNSKGGIKTHRLTPEEHAARIRAIEQAARLSWAEEGDESFGLRIVVIKHMFNPYDPETQKSNFSNELIEEIQPEVEGICGTVHKIIVFPLHPEGVVLVKFKSAGSAIACLNQFSGRYFGGQVLQVELWDGHTDYRSTSIKQHQSSNSNSKHNHDQTTISKDEEDRLDEFGKWLESGGE